MSLRPSSAPGQKAPYVAFPAIDGQNTWLDLLRAVAVSLVLLRHGARALPGIEGAPEWLAMPHALAMNGWVGVDLFLVLSGFLIGRGLIRTLSSGKSVRLGTYLGNRALRIIPAYYAVLLLTVIGAFPFFEVNPDGLGMRVIYHLLFLQDYLSSDINVVFWSLGVEEKFYLLAPLLVWLVLRLRHPAVALGLLTSLLCISPACKALTFLALESAPDYQAYFERLRSPFHASLEPLLIGVAIAWVRTRTGFTLSHRAAQVTLAVSAACFVLWLGSHELLGRITLFDAAVQPLLLALMCGAMVLSATFLSGEAKPAGEPVWRVIARLSYSLYLVHFALIPLAFVIASAHPSLFLLAFWPVYLTLSLAGAMALHFGVEKPFLLLKDRLPRPVVQPGRSAARTASLGGI